MFSVLVPWFLIASILYLSVSVLPVLVFLLLFVLAISSLLTVVERKSLAASQRRMGPSFHGWFGLLQIVADGLKLIGKDSGLEGFCMPCWLVVSMLGCCLMPWFGVGS